MTQRERFEKLTHGFEHSNDRKTWRPCSKEGE